MRKTHLYTLLCVLCFPSLVCAQQAVFDEFRKAAGDYAALYSGKAEENYNQQKYLNHPYWNTDEFREGAVCYGRWLYSYLQLRYDTYKKSLIVVTPEKRITLQVDMRKVDYFVIEGQKFVPQGDCFAALLYDSPQMCLTQYIVSTMESQVKKNDLYSCRIFDILVKVNALTAHFFRQDLSHSRFSAAHKAAQKNWSHIYYPYYNVFYLKSFSTAISISSMID